LPLVDFAFAGAAPDAAAGSLPVPTLAQPERGERADREEADGDGEVCERVAHQAPRFRDARGEGAAPLSIACGSVRIACGDTSDVGCARTVLP
jgi:hypothetical protein